MQGKDGAFLRVDGFGFLSQGDSQLQFSGASPFVHEGIVRMFQDLHPRGSFSTSLYVSYEEGKSAERKMEISF